MYGVSTVKFRVDFGLFAIFYLEIPTKIHPDAQKETLHVNFVIAYLLIKRPPY